MYQQFLIMSMSWHFPTVYG